MSKLDDIKARLAAITPGEWKMDRNWHITGPGHDWDTMLRDCKANVKVCQIAGPGYGNNAVADFNFLVAAPADLAWAVQRIEELEEALKPFAEACEPGTPRYKDILFADIKRAAKLLEGE